MAVKIDGVSVLLGAIDALGFRLDVATRAATAAAAHLVEAETKNQLTKYSHKRGTATPSPPGEPPALVTGTLRRSITVMGPTVSSYAAYEAQVGPTVVYGRIQELGGVTGRGGAARLPARPYLSAAYHTVAGSGKLREVYAAAWAAAIVA